MDAVMSVIGPIGSFFADYWLRIVAIYLGVGVIYGVAHTIAALRSTRYKLWEVVGEFVAYLLLWPLPFALELVPAIVRKVVRAITGAANIEVGHKYQSRAFSDD